MNLIRADLGDWDDRRRVASMAPRTIKLQRISLREEKRGDEKRGDRRTETETN